MYLADGCGRFLQKEQRMRSTQHQDDENQLAQWMHTNAEDLPPEYRLMTAPFSSACDIVVGEVHVIQDEKPAILC